MAKSYFPLLIGYLDDKNNIIKTVVVESPEKIQSGRPFKVLETNHKKD